MGISILGAGCCLPQQEVDNHAFESFIETSDEWITTRTGIHCRRISDGILTYQMGAEAARQALKDADTAPEEIDMVLATTVTADTTTPSLACLAAAEVGIKTAPCMDLNAACTGFVYALDVAEKYLSTGSAKKILILSAEMMSRIVNFKDRSSCVLFGDGAAAVVVGPSDKMYHSWLACNLDGRYKIFSKATNSENPFRKKDFDWPEEVADMQPGLMEMAGNEVYRFATQAMPEAVQRCCEKAGFTPEQLDRIIPHQANLRIIRTALKHLGLPEEKVHINIQHYGNISSACIPLSLCEMKRAGELHPGDKICLVGFGSGLTYGAAVLEW